MSAIKPTTLYERTLTKTIRSIPKQRQAQSHKSSELANDYCDDEQDKYCDNGNGDYPICSHPVIDLACEALRKLTDVKEVHTYAPSLSTS
jgi:hypothetical protein